jgi:hypothetical protein
VLLFLTACDGGASQAGDGGVADDAAVSRLMRDGGEIGGTCETGCTGFSYCDPFSGECRPGCGDDSACGDREYCDLVDRQCACAAGAHACGDVCASDSSPGTCGDRCTPCPDVAHGEAACVAGECAAACDPGYEACGGACVACPTAGVARTSCHESACVVDACAEGYGPCSTGCCPFTHEVAATLEVSAGYHLGAIMDGSTLRVAVSDDYGLQAYLQGSPSSLGSVPPEGLGWELHGPIAVLPGDILVGLEEREDFGGIVTKLVTYRRSGASWTFAAELEYVGGNDFHLVRCEPSAAGGGACIFADLYRVFAAAVAPDGGLSHPPIPAGDPGIDRSGWTLSPETGSRDARFRVDSRGRLRSLSAGRYDVVYRDNRAERELDPLAYVTRAESGTLAVELVLAGGDEPHLLIGGLRRAHVHRVDGMWVTEPLDLDSRFVQAIEAEADRAGNLHVAMTGHDALLYASYDGRRWAISRVDARPPRSVELVLSGDRPVIVAVRESLSGTTVETYTLPR